MAPALVLFDLGDVIATFDPGPRLAEYGRRSGLSEAEVRDRLSSNDFWVNTDRGVFTAEQMQQEICALLGCRFSREELLRLQAAAFTVRPEIVQIAEEVSARTRAGILTNNAPLLEEAFPLHFPELVRLFDPILFSYQFGHIKPEREIFESVAAHMALAPAGILLIDDQHRHVSAARSVGWDAIQFESVPQLRLSLAERGLTRGAA